MLETEWEFYENNRDGLVEKYSGKYIVISGDKVVSAYDDENVAYFETVKTIPPRLFYDPPRYGGGGSFSTLSVYRCLISILLSKANTPISH